MQIYLPIAELSVNILLILGLGGVTGILSGMFGVGGGFLTTPFLMFIGVSPAVAVASSANQIIGTSYSGFLAYFRKQNVDFKMGQFLLFGGTIGAGLGVALFSWLKKVGYIDVIISVSYVFFLGTIGVLMALESFRNLRKSAVPTETAKGVAWQSKLPWQTYFPHSKLQASAWLPIGIGLFVGMMVSIMGVGGGFLLIPALIYLVGMPTSVVIGTSLFQIIFVTAQVTLLQAITTHTVDILLALLLLLGSVVGAQFGSRWGSKIPATKLRALLAVLVLSVAARLAYGLFATPSDFYVIVPLS